MPSRYRQFCNFAGAETTKVLTLRNLASPFRED